MPMTNHQPGLIVDDLEARCQSEIRSSLDIFMVLALPTLSVL